VPYYYKSVDASELLESETLEPIAPRPSAISPYPASNVARSEPRYDSSDRSSMYSMNAISEQRTSQSDVGRVYPPSDVQSPSLSSSFPSSSAGLSNVSGQPLSSGKAAFAAQGARPTLGLQHNDSGIRFGEAGPSRPPPTEEVDIPPEYTES